MASPDLDARDAPPRLNAIAHAWSLGFLVLWGAATAVIAIFGEHPIVFAVISFVPALWLPSLVMKWTVKYLLRRAVSRLEGARQVGDVAKIDAAADDVLTLLPKKVFPATARVVVWASMMAERWDEALRALAVVERDRLNAADQITHDNDHAWILVHLGRQHEALPIARTVVDEARRTAHSGLGGFLDTLGVAQLLTGDPETALASLTEAAQLSGEARTHSSTAFHRGEALRLLGRLDDARIEYQKAIDGKGSPHSAQRARERLAGLPAIPYRE